MNAYKLALFIVIFWIIIVCSAISYRQAHEETILPDYKEEECLKRKGYEVCHHWHTEEGEEILLVKKKK